MNVTSGVLNHLRIKLYADGVDLNGVLSWRRHPRMEGNTSNSTLMAKSGTTDCDSFFLDEGGFCLV
ncbi:hypothetical protein BH11VER1_BH11VER1_00440 [soil metagenome]